MMSVWCSYEFPAAVWEDLRVQVIKPSEHAAIRTGDPAAAQANWLVDAWRVGERDGDVVRVSLDGLLAGVLRQQVAALGSPRLVAAVDAALSAPSGA